MKQIKCIAHEQLHHDIIVAWPEIRFDGNDAFHNIADMDLNSKEVIR